jgi:hypothetical protein
VTLKMVRLFDHEDEDTNMHRNVGNDTPDEAASHPRGFESSRMTCHRDTSAFDTAF